MQLFLEYVLFHFKRVYHLPEPLDISYGHNGQSRVQVKQTSSSFFEQQQAQPENVLWKNWHKISLPLFFDEDTDQPWFDKDAQGNLVVQYDLIAGAFYFLSGWQEFYSSVRDQFGRFPYRASVQAKYGLVTKPIVNYYFEILKKAVEQAYGQEIKPRTWSGKPFATCLTHDVDYLHSAWKVAGKPALQRGNVGLFLKLALKKFSGEDAWFNLSTVGKELGNLNAKGTFFLLPETAKHQGHPNADYRISNPRIQREVNRLATHGHEIALHGSHGTGTDKGHLNAEMKKIPQPISGNRFHYLRFDPRCSTQILEELDFRYDASLGFSERFGFRHSYCHPFRLFHFKERRMFAVWELPLNLMDITLHHPNYLQVSPDQVMPALMPMLEEIIRFNGVFTLLWHNENFSDYGLPGGLAMFREITSFLQEKQTSFCTASGFLDQVAQV